MSGAKKSTAARRVWRITPDHPHGAIVEADDAASPPPPSEPATLQDTSFRGSSWDLLNGVEVTDESDTIPDDLFDELFKH